MLWPLYIIAFQESGAETCDGPRGTFPYEYRSVSSVHVGVQFAND